MMSLNQTSQFAQIKTKLNPLDDPSINPYHIVFMGDLSYFCGEADIERLFSPFGRVRHVSIHRGVDGKSLLHGYVIMFSDEEAHAVCNQLNGIEFMGRKIKLNQSRKHVPQKMEQPTPNTVRVHFSFISRDMRFLITEIVIKNIFSSFGPVEDVSIKKHANEKRRQCGYGFGFFYSIKDAMFAKTYLTGRLVEGILFDFHVDEHNGMQQVPQMMNFGMTGFMPSSMKSNSMFPMNSQMSTQLNSQMPSPISSQMQSQMPSQISSQTLPNSFFCMPPEPLGLMTQQGTSLTNNYGQGTSLTNNYGQGASLTNNYGQMSKGSFRMNPSSPPSTAGSNDWESFSSGSFSRW